jgi:ferredoxin
MLTASMVKEAALSMGADLVGIGSMDRFAGAPKNYDPRYMFPEAKSIIGLGFRIHRGLLRPIEEGTHFGTYPSVGYANVNDVHMPVVMRELGSFIEDQGYEAVMYNNSAVRYGTNMGVPVRPGYPQPNVFLHFRIAGVICGMGEIGWSNIFLTPKFGPRQRLAFIMTDAELEPDPIYQGKLCDKCMRCVRDCPAQAISKDKSVNVTIDGKSVEYSKLDEQKCTIGFQCGNSETNPFFYTGGHDAEVARWLAESIYHDDSEEAQKRAHSDFAFNTMMRIHTPSAGGWSNVHHPGTICGSTCIRTCMIHLEEQGKLTNTFHTPFRIRPPWRLDPDRITEALNSGKKPAEVWDDDEETMTATSAEDGEKPFTY